MNRDQLIQQVKSEYARLARLENGSHFSDQSYSTTSPEAYYEKALQQAIRDISAGKFDDCGSGQQVVERIANHKTKSRRIQDTIESTLHNMEATQEIIASTPDDKTAQQLQEANQRRADVIPSMIRELKEEQAREELKSDSPNVIGGGGKG